MRTFPWFPASRDATPAWLAVYAERFGRPFSPGLLPCGPLHPVGRDPVRSIHAALASAWTHDPRRRRVGLLFGSAAARRVGAPIPFSRTDFLRRAPRGYLVTGLAAKPLGDCKFYYMRHDAWSRVMFRFPCDGPAASDRGAAIARFLERFDAFAQALHSRAGSLVAFEKDGIEAAYAIATPDRSAVHARSMLREPDFAAMLG